MADGAPGLSWLDLPAYLPRAAAYAAGKAARARAARSAHAAWDPPPDRPDPLATLRAGDAERMQQLLPVRYARMAQNPFTFFRGAAALMAQDVAPLPHSGIRTQICGDCHILNFGAFATPERNIVFDVNDFDETLPGAWEWDVKRLATSVAIAARHLGMRAKERRRATLSCLATYRTRVAEYARMRVLDVWYASVPETTLLGMIRSAEARRSLEASLERALVHTNAHAYPSMVERTGVGLRSVDEPPLIFHADEAALHSIVASSWERYRRALPLERRALASRFRVADAAYKVVGVGSVGTHSLALLRLNADGDPLVLQAKQAVASVWEPYAGPLPYHGRHGVRVVTGQHLMQAASDVFLAPARATDGNDFYMRQLRDVKTSANVENMTARDLAEHAGFCAWALARAHARAGGVAAAIAGYLGSAAAFDDAVATFAEAYADQNDRDYAALQAAIAGGEIAVATAPAK
jgi:uncharacterized protein (DUF2252 family)